MLDTGLRVVLLCLALHATYQRERSPCCARAGTAHLRSAWCTVPKPPLTTLFIVSAICFFPSNLDFCRLPHWPPSFHYDQRDEPIFFKHVLLISLSQK